VLSALSDDLNFHEVTVFLDKLDREAIKQNGEAAAELGQNLLWLGLFRSNFIDAYEDHVHGTAKPKFLSKYRREIEDARSIVLNSYKFSRDMDARQEELRLLNLRINERCPNLKKDGVRLTVDEHATVSLDSIEANSRIDESIIDQLIDARNAARKAKDFKKSDEIRDELAKMGVVLKDNKDGTTSWEIAR
jgi:cysteinyl-tRNA synthetase